MQRLAESWHTHMSVHVMSNCRTLQDDEVRPHLAVKPNFSCTGMHNRCLACMLIC